MIHLKLYFLNDTPKVFKEIMHYLTLLYVVRKKIALLALEQVRKASECCYFRHTGADAF